MKFLNGQGIQATHWSDIGAGNASDATIMAYAAETAAIVLTHDLDFGGILAATFAAAIAREERRRGVLERLSDLGMALTEKLTEKALAAPPDEESRHDPARSFAQLSRAVRLTLALETRSDERILALRNGDLPAKAARAPAMAAAVPAPDPQPFVAPAPPPVRRDSPCPRRNRIRDSVWEAMEREVRDPYDAQWLLDQAHERLVEGEDHDRFLFRDFRAGVEAICADLGLHPDWSRWSDETGFTRDVGRPYVDWTSRYRYSPEAAEANIRARDVRRVNAEALAAAVAALEPQPHRRQ